MAKEWSFNTSFETLPYLLPFPLVSTRVVFLLKPIMTFVCGFWLQGSQVLGLSEAKRNQFRVVCWDFKVSFNYCPLFPAEVAKLHYLELKKQTQAEIKETLDQFLEGNEQVCVFRRFLTFLTFRRYLPVRCNGSCLELSIVPCQRPIPPWCSRLSGPSWQYLSPQLRSSSWALPHHLHFDNCSDVFCFIASIDVHELFPPSHNHHYRFHLYCSSKGLCKVIFSQKMRVNYGSGWVGWSRSHTEFFWWKIVIKLP